ncbi:cytosolic protein [Bacillus sp. AFS076308]|uniref:cytosolic protein n=1 Tax=unclassified Bacillus (in: firmicutes) TaxID=185979 RepID=UPI000BF6E609|nr:MULTISPECIES: cytosolic protein [unclassified Bacillus (in: firmicutes)]PFO04917.1 cytosolic protein [Bacillus sp. AFS076308]PGV51014.1 cytosolic protein [Bacillus sp. AFS037270]
MESFVVGFHQEDNVDSMQIQKINQEEFNKATEGGTRHLFEVDTNIGLFVFFDAADIDGNLSYMVLQYEDDNEDPVGCYSFQLKDFYEFMALFLNDLEFNEETEEEEEQEYGPIHHLAHLLFHIVEAGKDLKV